MSLQSSKGYLANGSDSWRYGDNFFIGVYSYYRETCTVRNTLACNSEFYVNGAISEKCRLVQPLQTNVGDREVVGLNFRVVLCFSPICFTGRR